MKNLKIFVFVLMLWPVLVSAQKDDLRVSVKEFNYTNLDIFRYDLGTSPLTGLALPFPKDFEGVIIVEGFDNVNKTLTLRVSTLAETIINSNNSCEVNKQNILGLDGFCSVLFKKGRLSFYWLYSTDQTTPKHIVLYVLDPTS